MDPERTVRESGAHVQLDLTALLQLRCHRCLKKAKRRFSVGLGLVKRQISVLENQIRILRRIRGFSNADTGTDDCALAAEIIGNPQRIDDSLSHRRRRKPAITRRAEDHKLIAPKACHDVVLRSAMAEARSYNP